MKQKPTETGAGADETRLLRLVEEGNAEAFSVLFARYQGPLYRFALRMSGLTPVADDVVQEVFLALIRGNHGYRPSAGPLRPYLYGMARNLVRRGIRETEEGADSAEVDARVDESLDPLAGLTRGERIERVRTAVGALPVHYREVIVLCDLEGMGYEEAGTALGCAIGTVRSRLHRGRELLLQRLQEVRCLI